jgi:hypothetical protein
MGRWRIAILALCAFAVLLLAGSLFGSGFGLGGLPRTGLWGMQLSPNKPFTFVVTSLDPGRAASRAGIRAGDQIDMRTQSLLVRFWLLDEPIAGRSVDLKLLRSGRHVGTTVMPNSLELKKRPDVLFHFIAVGWMLAFAALLALRRPASSDVLLLSLTLICLAIAVTSPNFSFSSPAFYVVIFIATYSLKAVAVILWALYSGFFARPLSATRRIMQICCIVSAAMAVAVSIAAVVGEMTLWFSADAYLPLYSGRSEYWAIPYDVAVVLAACCSALAIAASRGKERQRAVWALVSLGLLFAANAVTTCVVGAQSSYAALMFWIALRNFFFFVAPIGLTYAALGRRLLDVGFVVNRAVIFGIVSLVVVAIFIIVEWGASEWLAGTNHAAPLAVSMAVALGLGLSMRFIHKHVDRFVDEIFFRKRHEDEAALRRFAKEAAYITERATLVQRAMAEVKEHTDAATVQLLVSDGNGHYTPANGVDDGLIVDENDRALVALRTWHKTVDLHRLDTALQGEYAYPMLSRGHLVGALVCGPKIDGDSYAPDESNALSELAHGVGTALDLLDDKGRDNSTIVLERLAELSDRIGEVYVTVRHQGRSNDAV